MRIPGHDRFTKFLLSDLVRLLEFLLTVLPRELAAMLDWKTLRVETTAYTGSDLREKATDLVATVEFKPGARAAGFQPPPGRNGGKRGAPRLRVHIVTEHKSWPDPGVLSQLFSYLAAIVKKVFADTGRYDSVMAVVFYTGLEPWTVPLSLRLAMGWLGKLAGCFPDVPYQLYSVRDEPEDRLAGNKALRAGTLLMKHAQDPAALERRLDELLVDLAGDGLESLKAALLYMLEAAPKLNQEKLRTAAERAAPGKGLAMVGTLYEQALAEGEAKGKAEGKAEGEAKGRINALLDMLEQGKVGARDVLDMIAHYQEHGDLTAKQVRDAKKRLDRMKSA